MRSKCTQYQRLGLDQRENSLEQTLPQYQKASDVKADTKTKKLLTLMLASTLGPPFCSHRLLLFTISPATMSWGRKNESHHSAPALLKAALVHVTHCYWTGGFIKYLAMCLGRVKLGRNVATYQRT